jgi:hypothetical protein
MEAGDATLMVSHGGKIQRCKETGRLTYKGGDNQLVKVRRSSSLRELHDRLAAVAGCFKVALKYVRPGRPLDELNDMATADDVGNLLAWALLRDLLIQLYGARSEKVVPRVRVFVTSMDVRRPLPEWLFSSIVAPTTSSSSTPVHPSSLPKRSASAPSLLANLQADDTSNNPPSPSLIQRSASSSRLTPPPSTNPPVANTRRAVQEEDILHYAVPFPAIQRAPAPVFLVPMVPVIVYHPVIPVYHGFLVPAGCPNVGYVSN